MNPSASARALLQTKAHFPILDGLRGVAALAVVVYHFMELIVPDYHQSFIAHGHLAVDFFFCLSGFVLAYAYDSRLEKLGVVSFIKLRLIRLHPLVVIGSVIGLVCFLFDPWSDLAGNFSPGKMLAVFIASCLLVPYTSVPQRYNNLFHLNPPTWSLLWEYIANVCYAFFLVRLSNRWLWVLWVVAAAALVYTSFHFGHLSVGWGGETWWGGGTRVACSFIAGMLVYRSKLILPSRMGFLSLSVLLLAAFLIPFVDATNPWADAAATILYFPLLVALGAGAQLAPGVRGLCRFSGEISYPLYIVHYPFIWLFMSYLEAKKPGMKEMTGIMLTSIPLLISLAYVVLRFVDEPLRKRLKKRMEVPQ